MATASSIASAALSACCSRLVDCALSDDQAEVLAKMFKALGDPTRVKLLSLIAAADDGEACICDMTTPVGLSQPTVSHHMKLLAGAGLATRTQRGKWAYYRIAPEVLTALATTLTTLGEPPLRLTSESTR